MQENIKTTEDISRWLKLADELDVLQKDENEGRGISCVKTILVYLRLGDVRSVKAICNNEADKIVNYPGIRKILQKELFSGDDDKDIPPHFRTSHDKLYDN